MELAPNVKFRQVYWVAGSTPKGHPFHNVVKDPPTSGYQHAIIVEGEKKSSIFCPFSMRVFHVSSGADEIAKSEEAKVSMDIERLDGILRKTWAECQRRGWQRDYDDFVGLFKRLKLEVPAQIMTGGDEDTRTRGGKEVGTKLLKPVKRAGKRGKFLEWFLDGEGSRSVREAMAEFEMTRSNALSYLYMLQKDHGIGYVLVGDTATIQLPDGCEDPFDTPDPLS